MRNAQMFGAVWLTCTSVLLAQEVASSTPAATVDEEIITIGAAERERMRLSPSLPDDPTASAEQQAAALAACVQRTLVLQELTSQKKAASAADVDQALARIHKQLKERGATLESYLKQLGVSESQLRDELRWGLTWDAYLKSQLTDTNLERYFDKHRRDFDGTQLRVAHILWKTSASDDRDAIQRLIETAETVRGEIVGGKLTFAQAAARYSQAPTAPMGGDIGWIERRRPMTPTFSAAAFRLETGEVTEPVETTLGVHLITCLEVKPGDTLWHAVRDELTREMTRYLFDWLAERRAKGAKVVYSGKYPYRDPVTRKLMIPR